jgi:ABC-type branched-subunit amino acid transport system permease subunit
VAALGLSLYFRSTTGVAMRGVVDNTSLLDLTGRNPTRVRRRAWIIGSGFAALSGMLIAPELNVDSGLLTLLVVRAFGACAIGRFSSLPLTYVGGLSVGIGEQLVQKWTAGHASLAQLYPATSFIVLFLVLLLMPRGRLAEVGAAVKSAVIKPRPAPSVLRTGILGTIGFGALALGPAIVGGTHISAATTALAQVILYLSLALLVRVSGQVSLGHIALQGAGAALYGHAISHGGLGVFNLGLPWPLALFVTGLLTIPLGLIVALPAVRLSGTFLALATLGFGLLLQQSAFTYGVFFGNTGSLPTPPPSSASGRYGYYYASLAVVVVCAGLLVYVERSRLGRLLRALSDSQTALTSLGTSVDVARTLAFALSAFLAGISGAIQGGVTGTSNEYNYQALSSLGVIAILAISAALAGVFRGGTVATAVVAGLVFTYLPTYSTDSNADAASIFQLAFGALALAVALLSEGRLSASLGRLTGSSRPRLSSPVRARADAVPATSVTA